MSIEPAVKMVAFQDISAHKGTIFMNLAVFG